MATYDILVVPDQHAHPDYSNERADWLARLTIDLKPDVVVNLGDAADMASLASYDKGKRSFHGKSYKRDIEAHLDFQSRWWEPVRATKKKLPYRVVLEGNHEQRVERALDLNPEYEGAVGFQDYDFDFYYDEVVRYVGGTPGTTEIAGITFAHYLVSGLKGLAVSGEHHAYNLVTKKLTSCVVGHSHLRDNVVRTSEDGRRLQGLVGGVYQDYDSPWAGNVNKMWWRGLVMLRGCENGDYDPEWISMKRIQDAYGR